MNSDTNLVTDESHRPVTLVTGAAKRIGRAIAHELHAAGARVAVHYRDSSAAAADLVEKLNTVRADSAIAVQGDLGEPDAPARAVAQTVAVFGRLDFLINNASRFYPTPLAAIDSEQWDDLMGTNLRVPLLLAKEAAPQLTANRGAIVNIADIYADRPLPNHALYCASKAGLVMLTRCLAIDLAPAVRVNAIAPGAILWPEQGLESDRADQILAATALKRLGKAQDIARAVRYLVYDADYTTGQVLAIDGGRSLKA